MKGVINVLKPPGMTSHDVVDYLRKLLRFKKIGHGGTLDPSAAGVLPVFVGRATTAIEFFVEDDKEYIAEISFGIVTDTGDFEGNIIKTIPTKIMESELKETLLQFTGEILQIPPMYSAVKYKGKKLYELARRGISVSRKPRKVKIHFIDLLDCNGSTASIKVACSKGTYIRTLCEDIGKELGCGSCLSCLVRTRSGSFTIKNSVTLEEIRKIIATDMLEKILLPTDNYLKSMPTVRLTSSGGIFTKGRRLYGDFEYLRGHVGKFVKVYNFEDFLGVAIVKKQGTQIILQVFKSLY